MQVLNMKSKSRSGLVVSLSLLYGLSVPMQVSAEARAAQFEQFKVRPEQKAEIMCDDSPGSSTRMEFRGARCPQDPGDSGAWLNAGLIYSPLLLETTTQEIPCDLSPGTEDQRKAVLPSSGRRKGRWIKDDHWNALGPSPPQWLLDLQKDLRTALDRSAERLSEFTETKICARIRTYR